MFIEPSKERHIVVFGGGSVALRKCRQFEGFHITVIADNVVPEMEKACDKIILEHFEPSSIPGYIKDAFVVVAATDSKKLNLEIASIARAAGILTNSAHGGGDLLLPSSVRKETYTVAISSEGSVPAFPPFMARTIDNLLGEEYDYMLKLLTELRSDFKDRISQQPMRAKFLSEVLGSEEVWRALRDKEYASAMDLARTIEDKYVDQ